MGLEDGTKRIDLKVGYSCNNNCIHCVIADRRGVYKDRDTQSVKDWLSESREKGFNDVVLTGGEFTIRKDSLEIISYAHELDFMINIQTNGRMLSYKKYCNEVIAAAGKKLSFTIAPLSSDEDVHNAITRATSWRQTMTAMSNLIEMNVQVNTNTVVTKFNYETLPALAKMLVSMGVSTYNLAFVHCCGNAEKYIDQVLPRKSVVSPYIKKALDEGISRRVYATVEAYPACFLTGGYEGYTSERLTPPVKLIDQPNIIEDFITMRQQVEKIKGPNCNRCLYFLYCEGPWIQYPNYYGWDEFIPIE